MRVHPSSSRDKRAGRAVARDSGHKRQCRRGVRRSARVVRGHNRPKLRGDESCSRRGSGGDKGWALLIRRCAACSKRHDRIGKRPSEREGCALGHLCVDPVELLLEKVLEVEEVDVPLPASGTCHNLVVDLLQRVARICEKISSMCVHMCTDARHTPDRRS